MQYYCEGGMEGGTERVSERREGGNGDREKGWKGGRARKFVTHTRTISITMATCLLRHTL